MSRRDQILETAAELFAAKGFHGVSVGQIGKACGISGPALYKHFESKDAVLAAMLVGIRTEPMQAIAWALAGASTGIAGALIALFFYISPTVGEALTLIAFITVCLGGFGSVPGALIAGLLIGVIQALSAFWDAVIYALFLLLLWFRPQGLLGRA